MKPGKSIDQLRNHIEAATNIKFFDFSVIYRGRILDDLSNNDYIDFQIMDGAQLNVIMYEGGIGNAEAK